MLASISLQSRWSVNLAARLLHLTERVYFGAGSKLSVSNMSAPAQQQTDRGKCVFCRICDGVEPNNILHQDDEFVVFPDIRPAAPHHYLIVPRHHYIDVKNLSADHIPMVEKMVSLSKEVLTAQGGCESTARLGFHWPPFHTVSHLHLHIIAPEGEMGFIARGMFKKDSFWFVSPETAIQRLRQKM
ncbi:histidine triad nucleotide-binding protein 3-like [Penaeus monodon]|uniref:histidine triad nucleotide-binding protein 3-like n=2 Tax=Penaeus TaxID=133894 RepID=UPI0018A76FEA|nr:histidine triad nucleotide-binding protein 3-like [Penaeus monodon]